MFKLKTIGSFKTVLILYVAFLNTFRGYSEAFGKHAPDYSSLHSLTVTAYHVPLKFAIHYSTVRSVSLCSVPLESLQTSSWMAETGSVTVVISPHISCICWHVHGPVVFPVISRVQWHFHEGRLEPLPCLKCHLRAICMWKLLTQVFTV